jgi:hypothetical protein
MESLYVAGNRHRAAGPRTIDAVHYKRRNPEEESDA